MDERNRLVVSLIELARRYRVPAAWLRREARAGRLPAIQAGSQHLFNVEAVERALAERAARSAEEGEHEPHK